MRSSILPALIVIGASFASSRPLGESEGLSVRNVALHSRSFDTDDTIVARHVIDEEETQLARRAPVYLEGRAGAPINPTPIPNGTPTTSPPPSIGTRNIGVVNLVPLTT